MWKLHNNKLNDCTKSLFNVKLNYRATRNSSRFQLSNPNSLAKRRFITFLGLKLWHNMPIDIKSSKSINIFKKKLKALISKQNL